MKSKIYCFFVFKIIKIKNFFVIEFVQQAPEIIREYITTKHLPAGSQSADIYGLGMVLYQILFKLEPFYERNMPDASKSLKLFFY